MRFPFSSLACFVASIVTSTGLLTALNAEPSGQAPTRVDLTQLNYFYDIGPPNSPVFDQTTETYVGLSELSHGDVSFTTSGPHPLTSFDHRGQIPSLNAVNRDFIEIRSPSYFNHKVANGIYSVLITIGDTTGTTEAVRFTDEEGKSSQSQKRPDGKIISHLLPRMRVTDGELNVKIETIGKLAKITRIVVSQIGKAVDLNQNEYNYDLGTVESPVLSNWTQITPNTSGEIYWSKKRPHAIDRGPKFNDLLRDLVYSNENTTFHHKIRNGLWQVTLTLGDAAALHDQMGVRAEGEVIAKHFTSATQEFSFINRKGDSLQPVSFDVEVRDGELNLEFFDGGGVDPNWVLNRISLKFVRDINLDIDTYNYDLGTAESPVLKDWTRLTPQTTGAVYWSKTIPSALDRGPKLNDLLRDFVYARNNSILHHKIRNGIWQVTLTLGDANTLHDKMGVRAEGELIAKNIASPARNFSFVRRKGHGIKAMSFDVEVKDEELNLEFFDEGGADPNWVLNRISLKRLKDSH